MRTQGKSSHKGFTLIEILLVIAILMGVGVMEMRRDVAKANDMAAIAVGKQITLIGGAVEQYMAAHTSTLQNMSDAACVSSGNYCTISITTLINDGLLPGNFQNVVKFGGTYVARVLRVPPPTPSQAATICVNANPAPIGCPVPYPAGAVPFWQWGLQGVVFTSDTWKTNSGQVEWALLGAAARQAGPLGGVTQSGTATGLYAGWTADSAFGSGLGDGQLVYLTGGQVNLWGQFVRRDGTIPMTGNLDMGKKNIMNMRDMFLNGAPTNPRNKNLSSLMPNWVFKGVYAAKDGDYIPDPMCSAGGVAKIKVMMQLMQGTKSSFYYDNGTFTATNSQAAAQTDLANNASKHALDSWADVVAAGGWIVHFQDNFSQTDSTGGSTTTKGEGLAELYCHYPDQ